MLHYWFDILNKAFWNSIAYVDHTGPGLVSVLLGPVLMLAWRLYKDGWSATIRRIPKSLGESFAVGFAVWAVIFFFCLLAVPYELNTEHVVAEARLKYAIDLQKQDYADRVGELRVSQAKISGITELNHALQRDINSLQGNLNFKQQNLDVLQSSVSRCVTALAKSSTPEPLRIKVRIAGLGIEAVTSTGQHKFLSAVIAEPNQTIPSVRALLECDVPFTTNGAVIAGKGGVLMLPGNSQIAPNKFLTRIDLPAWDMGVPLLFVVATTGRGPSACAVTQQE